MAMSRLSGVGLEGRGVVSISGSLLLGRAD